MDYLKKIRKGEKPPVELMLQEDWRLQPEVAEQLGEMIDQKGNFNLFPNFWITFSQVCLRLPKGVNKTELWWFTFVPEEYDDERRQEIVDRANHYFGPAGMLEQDDGENWEQSTRAMKGVVGQRYPQNYQMNLGLADVKKSKAGHTYHRHQRQRACPAVDVALLGRLDERKQLARAEGTPHHAARGGQDSLVNLAATKQYLNGLAHSTRCRSCNRNAVVH